MCRIRLAARLLSLGLSFSLCAELTGYAISAPAAQVAADSPTAQVGLADSLTSRHSISTLGQSAAPQPLGALQSHKLTKAGLQFDLPARWKVIKQANGDLVVTTPESGLSLSFTESTPANLDQHLERLLTGFVGDFIQFKREKMQIGSFKGMKHAMRTGTIKNLLNRSSVEWSLDIIEADCPLIIFSQVHSALKDEYRQAYGNLISSLRRSE